MKSATQIFQEKSLSLEEKQKLWRYLSAYLTERRRHLFERVVKERTYFVTVAVEDIYQERNASAVVRTAECFGIQSVYIIENQHEYRIAKGIAKGAEKWLDLHVYDKLSSNNTTECLLDLKRRGYRIVAATPHQKNCYIHELDLSHPLAFVIGGEKNGLSKTALSMAEEFVKIPIYGFTESYNVSVATAIILYETTRRLRLGEQSKWLLDENAQLNLLIIWALKSISRSSTLLEKYFAEQRLSA